MSEEDQFAYGYWEVGAVGCPLNTVGKREATWSIEVAELFDAAVQEVVDTDKTQGVVPRDIAESQWEEVKTTIQERKDDAERAHRQHMFSEMQDLVVEVEDELFNE